MFVSGFPSSQDDQLAGVDPAWRWFHSTGRFGIRIAQLVRLKIFPDGLGQPGVDLTYRAFRVVRV